MKELYVHYYRTVYFLIRSLLFSSFFVFIKKKMRESNYVPSL